jgi:hypothetical protein
MASITDKFYDLAQKLKKFPAFVGSVQIFSGAGAPGASSGPKGSLYLRTDGGANTTLYVREAAGSPTAATGTLTLTGNAVNNQTVTIGSTVYTFKTTLSVGPAVAYEILIGVAATNTLDNLIAAMNSSAGIGTTYSTGTLLHPTVSAAAGAGDTMTATAKVAGTAGNSIVTTDTLTAGSWAEGTLTGGLADDGTGWAAK